MNITTKRPGAARLRPAWRSGAAKRATAKRIAHRSVMVAFIDFIFAGRMPYA
jgi:hypothetical protein